VVIRAFILVVITPFILKLQPESRQTPYPLEIRRLVDVLSR
jgi:hypothetical protein